MTYEEANRFGALLNERNNAEVHANRLEAGPAGPAFFMQKAWMSDHPRFLL